MQRKVESEPDLHTDTGLDPGWHSEAEQPLYPEWLNNSSWIEIKSGCCGIILLHKFDDESLKQKSQKTDDGTL